MTPAEVRAWQDNPLHRDHLGARLRVDGDLGPRTAWSLDYSTQAPARRAVVEVCWSWLGVSEDEGPNRDKEGKIERALLRCGCKPGDPWCAAAASDCLSIAILRKVGGALRLGATFPPTDDPTMADLATYPTNDTGAGHVFFVAGRSPGPVVVGQTVLMTYEGNCDNAFRCARRVVTPAMRFWRTFANTTGRCPGVIAEQPWAGAGTR